MSCAWYYFLIFKIKKYRGYKFMTTCMWQYIWWFSCDDNIYWPVYCCYHNDKDLSINNKGGENKVRHLNTLVQNCFMNHCLRTREASNPSNNPQSKLGVYHNILHFSIEIVRKHHSGSRLADQPRFWFYQHTR